MKDDGFPLIMWTLSQGNVPYCFLLAEYLICSHHRKHRSMLPDVGQSSLGAPECRAAGDGSVPTPFI